MTARKISLADIRLRRLAHDLRVALEEQMRAEEQREAEERSNERP